MIQLANPQFLFAFIGKRDHRSFYCLFSAHIILDEVP